MPIKITELGDIEQTEPVIEDWLQHAVEQYYADCKVEDVMEDIKPEAIRRAALVHVTYAILEGCILEDHQNLTKEEIVKWVAEAFYVLDAFIKSTN